MTIQKRFRMIVAVAVFLCFVAMLGMACSMGVSAEAADMTIGIKDVTALPEDSVQVQIYLENNPGLASLKFDVEYDEILTLQKVEFSSAFGAYVTAPEPYSNPQTISFISPLAEIDADGVFATLTFQVPADVPDKYDASVRIICDHENIFDGDYDSVSATTVNGKVHIIHGYPGDINGDRVVNNMDPIILFRYVTGMSVKVDPDALDVNGDGRVNNRDAVILFRYLAGWDVEISRGPAVAVCQHERTEIVKGFEPTCTETGLTDGERCAVCMEMLVQQSVLPAKGHEWGIWNCVQNPTCTEEGLEQRNCLHCESFETNQVEPLGHEYGDNGICTRCGDGTPTGPAFVVSKATAKAGETVEVTVSLKNNPGIASIILELAFDNDALTLNSVTYNNTIGGYTIQPQYKESPIKLYWIDGFANAEGDFVLATLSFTVKDDAALGDHALTVSYRPDDVYDISETNLPFEIVNGAITVKE